MLSNILVKKYLYFLISVLYKYKIIDFKRHFLYIFPIIKFVQTILLFIKLNPL